MLAHSVRYCFPSIVSFAARYATTTFVRFSALFSLILFGIMAIFEALSLLEPSVTKAPNTPQISTTTASNTTSAGFKVRKYVKAAQWFPTLYSHCLAKHHLATESVTAGCLAGVGDFIAQRKAGKPWSPRRSFHFILKGLGEGIIWSFWYHQADQWVASWTQAALLSGWLSLGLVAVYRTVLSLVLDFFVACPLIYSLWDIPLPALLSGSPWRDIPRQVKGKLGEMMLASLKLWTPFNILIYNSPLEYRVVLMSIADVFWQTIVSSIATRELLTEEEEIELGVRLLENVKPC